MSFVKQSTQSMRGVQSSSKLLQRICNCRSSAYSIATHSSRTFITSASKYDFRSNSLARPIKPLLNSNWVNTSSTSHFTQQKRSIFIQTESTPNEDSLKFLPGQSVMSNGTAEFLDTRSSMTSPLAKTLFGIKGVKGVFYGPDFVTVSKDSESHWNLLKPEIYASIMEFFSSEQELFPDPNSQQGASDTVILDTDSETVAMIKELLETRVRPAIQEDGGDIEYRGFGEETDGIVRLKLKGSCRGCDSSTVTLKTGIERMLMHYIPEVKAVEQVLDPEEEVQLAEFAKLEARLEKERKQRETERDMGFSP